MEKDLLIHLLNSSPPLYSMVVEFVSQKLAEGTRGNDILEIIRSTREVYKNGEFKITAIKHIRDNTPERLLPELRKQFPNVPANYEKPADRLGLAEAKFIVESL